MCHRAAYHLEQFEDKSTNEADNNDSMFSLVRSPNHCSQLSEPSVWTGHQPKTCRYSVRYLDGRRQRARSTRAFHFQSTTSTRYRPPRRFLPSVLFRVNGVSGKVFFSLSRGLLSYSHQEPRIFISMHITKISSFILDLKVSLFQRLQV